jgi:hypothetical protein
MDLIGRFSNQEVIRRIDRLSKRLDAQRLVHGPPSGMKSSSVAVARKRRQSGQVQEAVLAALDDADRCLRVCELYDLVRESLGENVSLSSVRMVLRRGLKADPPMFVQPSYGRYRLP